MTVRLMEWEKPYTAGDGIDISTDKVISVLLREENNLIHLNSNNELYTDLQIVAWVTPTDDFEVWVTTWRVLESDGRPHTWTLLHYETTSGDYCQWLYGTDTNLYFDWWDGNWRQVYYSDQANEIFMRWMDFYRQTKTWNSIILDLNTEYNPTWDFTVNAPSTIKEWQTYILRVNNWATVYTMTLGNGINNIQGTNINLTPNATDMFVFLAIDGILELQKEISQWKKIFYIDYNYTQADTVWAEMAERLNATWQPDEFNDACVVETDVTRLVYDRIDAYWIPPAEFNDADNNEYIISFGTRTRIENNSADGTSRTKMYMIRFIFSYSNNTWTYLRFEDTQFYTTEKYLRADYDYATPYTPLYNGSPATKKYVDDKVTSSATAPSSPTEWMLWYDTTNDVLKVYDWTNWNLVWDDTANINTKTFYLSGTNDLTNAQAAYDWYKAGKNPIIAFSWTWATYTVVIKSSSYLAFTSGTNWDGVSWSYSYISDYTLYLDLSWDTVTSIRFNENTQWNTSIHYLDTNVNYWTPYTPQYNGSPATKKYVDDHDTVISGDTWVTYTIKVAHSDPSGVANNVITFVTPLLEYSELVALNNATAIVNELNSDPSWYFNKYLQEWHIGEDFDPELVRPNYYYLEDNGTAFTIDWRRFLREDWTTEWFYEG